MSCRKCQHSAVVLWTLEDPQPDPCSDQHRHKT